MAITVTKLARIGNSKGVRIPAPLVAKYHLEEGVTLEEHQGGLLIKSSSNKAKLSWEETAKAMVTDDEDWTAWESMKDGLEEA